MTDRGHASIRAPTAFEMVRQTLVVLAANNSGSTVLRNAVAASSGCWQLPREAQHVAGFAGPSTRGTGTRLIWAATQARLAQVSIPTDFDWAASLLAWMAAAHANEPKSPVLVLSSPPFLFAAEALKGALPDPRFVVLVRDPYATAAGILRRRHQQTVAAGEDIRELAAMHVVHCLAQQARNVAALGNRAVLVSYEGMTADPRSTGRLILALVPELRSIDLVPPVPVKGMYHEPLRDMNAEAIRQLSAADRAVLSRVFAAHADTLAAFGYRPHT